MCEHTAFASTTKITRLSDREDGPTTGYLLQVTVTCEQCGVPFVFQGTEQGFSFQKPTISGLGERLTIPMQPMSAADQRLASLMTPMDN